jgi:hypothetical protein
VEVNVEVKAEAESETDTKYQLIPEESLNDVDITWIRQDDVDDQILQMMNRLEEL